MKGHLLIGGTVVVTMVACGAMVLAGAEPQSRSRSHVQASKADRTWDSDDDGDRFNVRTETNGEPVTSCNQIEVTVRHGEVARDEEVQTVPRAAGGAGQGEGVTAIGHKNGPVSVTGTDRSDYQITLCKFGIGDTMADAQARAAELTLSVQGNRVSVEGPNSGGNRHLAYLIVETPRNAKLDVSTTNGPLSLHSVNGQVLARAQNGPLSVEACSGDLDIQSRNGPVTLNNASGKLHVDAQNGPLAVNLSGQSWQGAGLDASAHNGPLSLMLPENYRSGVRVELSGHSPVSCHASACQAATKNWDDDSRTLQFGAANPVLVRVSATNGPVSIGSSNRD